MFVYVGGHGKDGATIGGVLVEGGFNGGGNAGLNGGSGTHLGGGSGGGASDIRLNVDSLYSRVIVAAGGGGGGNS